MDMVKKRTKAQIAADAMRTGRPPKPKNEKQGHQVRVNLTEPEFHEIKSEADSAGLSLSAYMLKCWYNQRKK